MSEESTPPDLPERARAAYDGLNSRDPQGMVRFFAPDGTFESLRLGVSAKGREAVLHFASEWLAAFDQVEFVIEELLDLGGGVTLTVVQQNARLAETEAEVSQRDAWVAEWVDGLAVRITAYGDIGEARQAAERLARERERTVSQENVEVVRAALDAFNRRDGAAFDALLANDGEIVPVRAAVERVAYVGAGAGSQYCAAVDERWENLRWEVEDVRGDGDWVLALGRIRGRGRDSGAVIDATGGWVAHLRAGHITRFQTFSDRGAALKAVGLEK